MTYREQLLHPNWQRKRLEMLESAGWECANCGTGEVTLHVHHRQYFKGRMAWEYGAEELDVLCERCHQAEHANLDLVRHILACINAREAAAFLAGAHMHNDTIEPAVIAAGKQADALAFAAGFVGYLVHNLDIDDMLEVARFAAAKMAQHAEARMLFTHSRGNTFGERPTDA